MKMELSVVVNVQYHLQTKTDPGVAHRMFYLPGQRGATQRTPVHFVHFKDRDGSQKSQIRLNRLLTWTIFTI